MNASWMETAWGEQDVLLQIERGEEFLQAARELSDFIKDLNLPNEQNDKLVKLVVAQTLAAERNAFFEGGRIGLEFGRSEFDNNDMGSGAQGP